jgi:hypothetical protein
MAVTIQEELPGGTTLDRLQEELRRSLGRPHLLVDVVDCVPIDHPITAPATGSLTRVVVRAHDPEPVELRLVAKVVQSAIHGLPPFVPLEDRQRIAAGIPWRLEPEVYTAGTADLMPPGLRLPRLFAAVEHPDDRITLWLEDVDPVEDPWSAADLARAATGLGRLTVRRAEQVLHTLPPGAFLPYMVENALHQWALPVLRGDDVWAHPAFGQPAVAALRDDLLPLADDVDDLLESLSGVPWTNTHGDPTPMNMLRPRSVPEEFVLIDWGTASRGPVGWDVVPLVFGPAENGTAPADDLPDRLAVAVPAFESGLAVEGMHLAEGAVAAAVRACALLRYPFTSLPLSEVTVGRPERDDLAAYARRKAAFVRAVLDACA